MMIMAVLARHVPRRRLARDDALGEKLDAEEAARLGLVNRAVAPEELDAEVKAIRRRDREQERRRPCASAFAPSPRRTTWSSSERSRCSATASPSVLATDDAREGLMAFLEKRATQVDGEVRTTMPNMRELVADLEARRAKVREMGGADKSRQAARARQDDGARAARGALRRRRLLRDRHARYADGPRGGARRATTSPPPTASSPRSARSTGGWCCCAAYDFTVKGGSIGYTGEEKVTRLRSMALKGAGRWCGSSTRAGARIDPGSSHPDMISLFAGIGAPLPRAGRHERRRPAGRGDGRPRRGGDGVHPGPRRLRADGQGHRHRSRSAARRSSRR